jgi:hypothetical protein
MAIEVKRYLRGIKIILAVLLVLMLSGVWKKERQARGITTKVSPFFAALLAATQQGLISII